MSASVCEVIYDGKLKRQSNNLYGSTTSHDGGRRQNLPISSFRFRTFQKTKSFDGRNAAPVESEVRNDIEYQTSTTLDRSETFEKSSSSLDFEDAISAVSARVPSLPVRHPTFIGSGGDYDAVKFKSPTNVGFKDDHNTYSSFKKGAVQRGGRSEIKKQPVWNPFLNTWVADTKPTTYIHFVRNIELVDRGFYKNTGRGNRFKMTLPRSPLPGVKRTPVAPPKTPSVYSLTAMRRSRDIARGKRIDPAKTLTASSENLQVSHLNQKSTPGILNNDSRLTLEWKQYELDEMKKQRREHLENLKSKPQPTADSTQSNSSSDKSTKMTSSPDPSMYCQDLDLEPVAEERINDSSITKNTARDKDGDALIVNLKNGGTEKILAKNCVLKAKVGALRNNSNSTSHLVSPASDSDKELSSSPELQFGGDVGGKTSVVISRQLQCNKNKDHPRSLSEKKEKRSVISRDEIASSSSSAPFLNRTTSRHTYAFADDDDVSASTIKSTSEGTIMSNLIHAEELEIEGLEVETQIGSAKESTVVEEASETPGHVRGHGIRDTSMQDELRRLMLADERRRAMDMYEKLKRRTRSVSSMDDKDGQLVTSDTDWLSKYCVLDSTKISIYRKVFDEVDEHRSGHLSCVDTLVALRAVNFHLTQSQVEYLYTVMEIAGFNASEGANFELFSVLAALSHHIAAIDGWMKTIIKATDLKALGEKLFKCKSLWECCVDADSGLLSIDDLCIELRAGGVSYEHEQEVRARLGHLGDLDLLDYLTYIPLFIMIHKAVIGNPLSTTRDK